MLATPTTTLTYIAVVSAFEKLMITMVQERRRTLLSGTVLAMISTSPTRQSRGRAEEYRASVQAANRNFSTNLHYGHDWLAPFVIETAEPGAV